MKLEANDFDAIADSAIKLFDRRVAQIDSIDCQEIDVELARLESQVIQLYGIAALLARRESELEKTAETWGAMVSVCDEVASRMQSLCSSKTARTAIYERILDIRNKSTRLRDLHL